MEKRIFVEKLIRKLSLRQRYTLFYLLSAQAFADQDEHSPPDIRVLDALLVIGESMSIRPWLSRFLNRLIGFHHPRAMPHIKRLTFDSLKSLSLQEQEFVVELFHAVMRADGPINGVEQTHGQNWLGLIGVSRQVYEKKLQQLETLTQQRK